MCVLYFFFNDERYIQAKEKASKAWLGDETWVAATARQSLVAVMGNLRGIYDTKFCSPGALGSLQLGLLVDLSRFKWPKE